MSVPSKAAVDAAALVLFVRHYINREDSSREWAESYWGYAHNREHMGDCTLAVHKGPITCDRCVCDEFREDARAALAAAEVENARLRAGGAGDA